MSFRLNGKEVSPTSPPTRRLSEVLREELGHKEVKVGCNAGDCGACGVLIDGKSVCACMVALGQVEGAKVETVAGLGDQIGRRLRAAFQRHGAAQCGICTPGMMIAAAELLRQKDKPSAAEVEVALGGVLCRCTGYRKIIDAVMDVARPQSDADGVGGAIPRLDGLSKVTGAEKFGDDVAPAEALVLRLIRSPHHHARFSFGDLKAWQAAHPEVLLLLTAKDVPGKNRFGVIPGFIDQPVFAEDVVRFRGEAVAAVVGEAAAMDALNLSSFPVIWVEKPPALSMEEALITPPLFAERPGNIMCRGRVQRGDVEGALAKADLVIERRFETAFVEHAYIEPEAGFAVREGNRLAVHACTQAPHLDRDGLAEIMGLKPSDIRIVPTAVGGGFGSKLDLSLQPYVAIAAWKLGRPVRLTYSRRESMQSTTKRHPAAIAIKLGVMKDGRIVALDFAGDFNTGAYASWGPTVANRVPVHASGPYVIPNYRAQTRAIHTHCPPSGAFRGFGVPQSAAALETVLDEAADRLGLDRLQVRQINALKNGLPTVTGQIFEKGVGILECFAALKAPYEKAKRAAAQWNANSADKKRGVGLAAGWYGCGNTSLPNPSTIKAGLKSDGTLLLHQGAVDIGQGANTVITQIFAEAFGVATSTIQWIVGDSDTTPDAGKTSASRQTFVTGNAAKLAGQKLRGELLRRSNLSDSARIEVKGSKVELTQGSAKRVIDLSSLAADAEGFVIKAIESYDPPTKPLDKDGQGDPYAQFGYAAHLVELEVDLALGTVKVLKITAAHDVGRAINPLLVEGQVEGGIAQGLGMALMEDYVVGRTENLHDYLIPTIGDIPPIETLIVEVEDPHGPFGAKGLGEHALIPTAPAILNAIRDATGARVERLPATPERVLAAIRQGVK